MIEDTGLVNQQYSWLTTIFYLTYLVGEFPSNFLLQRWSLGKSLSIYMLLWGESLLLDWHIFWFYSYYLQSCRSKAVCNYI